MTSPALSAALDGIRALGGVRPLGDPDLGGAATGLPVDPVFAALLPGGLPRGRALAVSDGAGATTLVLSLLAAASSDGAWCALVDLPATGGSAATVNAEAVVGLGVVPERLVVVRAPAGGWSRSSWVTTVGALVDAFDVVAFQVAGRPAPGDVQRLAARARARGTVLLPCVPEGRSWPGTAARLQVTSSGWSGLLGETGETGGGRLRCRQVVVTAAWSGRESHPRSAPVALPTPTGAVGADSVERREDLVGGTARGPAPGRVVTLPVRPATGGP